MANIMQQLKESTRESNNNAESQEFQRLLASGDLPRNLYVKYLEQLWIIHSSLENHLKEIVRKDPALTGVVTDDQLQVPFLQQDLEFFGSDPQHASPTQATQWILGRLEKSATEGPALIGSHYVLLGSKHGGKFIAHSLQQKYHLNEGKGAIYFDPYGTNFQQIWKGFAGTLNEVPLTFEQEESMVKAAKEMFEGVGRLSEEMVQMQVS